MNRVIFHVIQDGTSINYDHIKLLQHPAPNQIALHTQSFPIYPITVNLYLENPPFNKISLSFLPQYAPKSIAMYGSENGVEYVKFKQLKDLEDRAQEAIHVFEGKIFFSYVKLQLDSPLKSKENLCSQIKMRGLQFSMVTFLQARFVCSLKAKLSLHPSLYRLLEVIQYKYLILKQDKNKLCSKYERRMQEITKLIDSKKIDPLSASKEVVQRWDQQVAYLQSEPISIDNFVQYPDPVQTKKDINRLQKDLQSFSVDRLAHIKPHVQHYFQKYENKQIRQKYLRELSSHQKQDHNKALINFWNQVKKLQIINSQLEEAILMFFNFYLEFLDSNLKTSALKILILFNKNNPNPKAQPLSNTYDRILHNIIKYIHLKQDEQFFQLSLKYCFMLFDRVSNQLFVTRLLADYKSYSLTERIQKLQILQKVSFRGLEVGERKEIVDFLIDILLEKEITLTEKNRAYNVAAYLASVFGKEGILKDCEKLNSMILMTMEKNIDNKIGKIKRVEREEAELSCEFCGVFSSKFKDENLYDLHLARECRFITSCQFCSQNIEIPEVFKHYIEQCPHKHEFKHCENCFQVIQLKDEEAHNKACSRKLETKCPLCYEKMSSKLKLKEHLIVSGCPNNPR